MAYFTSSATWTVPTGITKVRVIAIGGGGGGAGGPTGGGGGGYAEDVVSVEGFSTLPITVGIGGNGGGGSGTAGGSSGFLHITASGGSAGTGNGVVVSGGNGISASIAGKGGSGGGGQMGGGGPGNPPWVFTPLTSSINAVTIGCGGYGDGVNGISGSVTLYY